MDETHLALESAELLLQSSEMCLVGAKSSSTRYIQKVNKFY